MKLRPLHLSSYRLFTDGASRGNPGPSGAGAALYTPSNTIHARLSSFLGHQTNNAAEYHAVVRGLLLARSLQIQRVLVLSDSNLLVQQMNGRYSVCHPVLRDLHSCVTQISRHFDVCRFAFLRREHNVVADGLANVAIDDDLPLQLSLETEDCSEHVRKTFEHLQRSTKLLNSEAS